MKKERKNKLKIFATCGSALEFDDLTKKLDEINKNKKLDVTIQTGKGKYIPKNSDYFKFTNDMNKYYDWADVVITHTGAGTIFELLNRHKKIIVVVNKLAINNHELAKKFDDYHNLKFVLNMDSLFDVIKRGFISNKYKFLKNNIPKNIIDFIYKL